MSLARRAILRLVSLILAACLWLPLVHLFYTPSSREIRAPTGLSERADGLARRHILLWTSPSADRQDVDDMRRMNAEWDFMGRTYVVLSMANIALRDGQRRGQALEVMDRIIEDTLAIE